MEKRLFIAILLSLAVLHLWSTQYYKPKDNAPEYNMTQTLEAQEDKASPPSTSPMDTISKTIVEKKKEVPEKINTLENSKILVEFSNIGGSIKNILIKEYDSSIEVTDIFAIEKFDKELFKLSYISDDTIIYNYKSANRTISKTYKLVENDYLIESKIEFASPNMSNLELLKIKSFTIDMSNLESKSSGQAGSSTTRRRNRSLNEYAINYNNTINRKNNAYKFSNKDVKTELGNVEWVGFRDRYYCAIVKPQFETAGFNTNLLSNEKLSIDLTPKDPKNNNLSAVLYYGPEKLYDLKKYNMGFDKITLYYRFTLFDAAAKLILWILHNIHKVVPNWGLCIILISIIIYFSMYPLTLRSLSSMKKMQALQPKIAALKEKYKNNPQKMNQEMMLLYKENHVNPLGGCLPMLLQMPVFIGLYQVLWRSVSLKGAHFLWIKDLSEPDRLFTLPNSFPVIGTEINILPVVMMIVMFFQQKLSAKNMSITDPAQATQQKMMATFFPIFLGFIFYKFASGLTLYFTMFYIFSTFTQWRISKK